MISSVTMQSAPPSLPLPALVLDGSAPSTFVGVLGRDYRWLAQCRRAEAPLEGLFPAVSAALAESGCHFGDLRSQVYAAGPGSVLGLRLCAMAMETWRRLYPEMRPLYAYNSLQLTAALLRHDHPTLTRARILSDWKKDLWNSVALEDKEIGELRPIPTDAPTDPEETLYHLPARKGWQTPPAGAQTLSYQPERLPEVLDTRGLLHETPEVELYSAGANTFQKWTAQRHPPSPSGATA